MFSIWVARSEINSLDESQVAQYKGTDLAPEFATYFSLARENNGKLNYWMPVILECKRKAEERDGTKGSIAVKTPLRATRQDQMFGSEGGDDVDEDDSHLEDSDYEGPVRKKTRWTTATPGLGKKKEGLRNLMAPSPPPSMRGALPTPPVSVSRPSATPAASSQPSFIKPDPENEDQTPAEDVVEIFVGRRNSKFECSRTNLLQSAVLTSFINTRDPNGQSAFMMHPSLSAVDPFHFTSVLQFLTAHEYEPILLQSSEGKFYLDDSSAPIDYAADLVRSAHLFNLAKQFQLPSLAHLIFRKVLYGHDKYDAKPFLSFAKLVLDHEGGADFERDGVGGEIKGKLEEWVIRFLAEDMQEFLGRNGGDAAGFWDVVGIKGVELRVLRERVKLCETFPGGRIKIED